MITNQDIVKLKKTFATKKDLTKLEKKFDAKFERLITAMFNESRRQDREHEKTREEIRETQNTLDAFMVKIDRSWQEHLMLSHKVDRHDRWIHQLGNKVGVELRV